MKQLFFLCIGLFHWCIAAQALNTADTPNNHLLNENWRHEADSLTRLLSSRNSVTEGFILCQIGSICYRNFEPKKSLQHAAEALKIGRENNNDSLIVKALRLFADNCYSLADYEKSTGYFLQELEYHEKAGNKLKIAELYCNLGVNYEIRGMLEKGMAYYFKARKLYEEIDNKEGLVATYSNMAYVYRSQGNLTEAIGYFRKAAAIENAFLTNKKEHYFLVNIAECQVKENAYDSAMLNLIKAETQIHDIAEPDDEDYMIWIDACRIMGDVHKNRGNYKDALAYYQQALTLCRQTNSTEKEGEVITFLAQLLITTGEFTHAEQYLKRGLEIVTETGSFYLRRDVYKALSMLYGKQKRFREAWEYHQMYSAASDSVLNIESAKQMADLQVKYQTEQKENRITLLTKEKEIQQLRLQKSESRRIYTTVVALLFLALAGLTYNRYRTGRRASRLLREKNSELQILNATKDKFFTIIAHDLKNPVKAFHTIAGQIEEHFDLFAPEELKAYISELSNTSSNLLEMLKNLLDWARAQLNQFQIVPVETNVEKIIRRTLKETESLHQRHKIEVVTEDTNTLTFTTDENIVVTVLRNLVTNALKFSPDNSTVTLGACRENGEVLLRLTDQGEGLTKADIDKLFRIDADTRGIGNSEKKGSGLGLILCRELIHKIGGDISVESIPQKGSTFTVRIPQYINPKL
ncbi:MAG: tetratricopeptide repeat-containing sensor histidine kinase [Bacteroidales bacterium]